MDGLSAANGYCVDDLRIDVRMRRVTRGDVDLGVTGLSFDLLLALARAAPGLVSVDALMEQVWRGVVVGPETISQRVKLLRQALGETADNPRYIVAVRNHGYRMAAAVVAAPDTAAAEQALRWRLGMSRWVPALLALALVVAASGVWWGFQHRVGRPLAGSSGNRPLPSVIPKLSVAVLPFANLTGDSGKDYFSDGMAEELINSLTQVPGLKVPARTSSFAYKGRNIDIRGIAHDLGVGMILEGSVRSAGERVRVTAELVDTGTGYHVWSQSYDRQFADLFKLQDDLAAAIVAALQQHLGVPVTPLADRTPPTQDVEAYRLYLQAASTTQGTLPSLVLALPLINQALARDPDFAPALALRAGVQCGLAVYGSVSPDALDGAEHDAERALAISPGLAAAHAALGEIHAIRGNPVKAAMSYQVALRTSGIDPGIQGNIHGADSWIHDMYALTVLAPTGQLQQALSHASEALHLAPAYGFAADELAAVDSMLGRDADAVRLSDFAGRVSRPLVGVELLRYAYAAARHGRYAQAAEHASRALSAELRNNGGTEAMKLLYAAQADPAQRPAARRALQRLIPRLSGTVDRGIRSFFVVAFAMLGDLDSAYEVAGKLVDQGGRIHVASRGMDPTVLWLPEMRPFRADPRFEGLVERLGLIDYWKQYGPPDGCDLKDDEVICH